MQTEMKLNKMMDGPTDKELLKTGCCRDGKSTYAMTQRIEHRLGLLMVDAHKHEQGAFRGRWPKATTDVRETPAKTKARTKASYKKMHLKSITGLIKRDGWVTSKTLGEFAGLTGRGAAGILLALSPEELQRGELKNGAPLFYTLNEVK